MRIDGNDAWLRQKILREQAEKGMQAQAPTNIQPNGQLNGKEIQNAEKIAKTIQPPNHLQQGAQTSQGISPQGPDKADVSAIGEKPTQMSAQAADSSSKLQDEEKSAAANARLGDTTIANQRRFEIEEARKKKIEQPNKA